MGNEPQPKKKAKKRPGYDPQWAEAKKRCRLNLEDIRMAKELGLNPRKLMRNNPSPQEPWKAPVREWIRDLYRRRHPQAAKGRIRNSGDRSRNDGNAEALR